MAIPTDFRLISYLSQWERLVRYPLSSSYPESISVNQLLALGSEQQRAEFGALLFDYPPLRGGPELLTAISAGYEHVDADGVISFAGADEAIYATLHALLDSDDHAVVLTPNYQSLETVALSRCAVSGVALDPERNWALDLDRLYAALRPNTRALVINFPHNPTGAQLRRDELDAVVTLCRQRGIWLLSDEVYRLTEYQDETRLPQVADLYERGISLNVMSKAYGLPGLRIGWIACRDPWLIQRAQRVKQYLTICNARPCEWLATLALTHREPILTGVRELILANLAALDAVLLRYPAHFDWQAPSAGLLAFPRYKGAEGAEAFAARLVTETGVLLVPSSAYRSELNPVPVDYLRIGFGRAHTQDGLAALDQWLARQ